MAKQTTQVKSVRRRSHSSIDALPVKLRTAVEKMIVCNKWPSDFRRHYNGTPRLCDVVSYCKRKGYRISKSALCRFAKQIQEVSVEKIAGDFRNYARAHLGTLCLVYANIQRELEISVISSDKRKALDEQQEKNITRIENLIASLRKLDSSYPRLTHGG